MWRRFVQHYLQWPFPFVDLINASEPLGEETDVTLDGPGGIELLLRQRFDAPPAAGSTLHVAADAENIHRFAAGDGARID